MSDKPVFLFIGVYSDPALAREDLEVVRDLHAAKVIGTYDAAVATKKRRVGQGRREREQLTLELPQVAVETAQRRPLAMPAVAAPVAVVAPVGPPVARAAVADQQLSASH